MLNKLIYTVSTLVILFLTSCCPCLMGKSNSDPIASLTNTYWKVTKMEGVAVKSIDNYSETYFVLRDDNVVQGSTPCHRIRGTFTTDLKKSLRISFSELPAICDATNIDQVRFLYLLELADSFNIDGEILMLFNNSELLMVCHSVYL